MNKNEKFVITINRELGSGGRTVGEKLAAKLGVPFYDKAVIKSLEEKYHLTVEEIETLKGRKQNWWADFKRVVGIGEGIVNRSKYYQVAMGEEPELLTTDEVFKAEKEIVNEIADEESSVIAGRTAFFILRNIPNRLSILIQAPMAQRIERVMRKQGLSREDAEKAIKKVDKMRENYVNKYTGTSRYDTRNYDLVISMEGKTEDEVVDLILKYIG
ncbi:MAG: cytidylate kinase-like family protein [Prevotella sp.]|jgi:cytidylate kinase|nr:cytidylate kinase-like family protein [Prevotella sp.]